MMKPQGRGRKYSLLAGVGGVLLAYSFWLMWAGPSADALQSSVPAGVVVAPPTPDAVASIPFAAPDVAPGRSDVGADLQSDDLSALMRDASSAPSWKAWDERFHTADDMVTFMNEAREAVDAGDAEAAWMMFESIILCLGPMRAISFGEQAIQQHLEPMGIAYVDEQTVRNFQRCQGVLNAFAGDYASPDDYMSFSIRHWRQVAMELGSARARADAIPRLLHDMEDSRGTIDVAGTIQDVRRYVRDVVHSDDAFALTQLGLRLMQRDVSKDWRYGAAMFLAACEMGYDCSNDNPHDPGAICRRHPELCPADSSFRNSLEVSLPARMYAQVDALAERFKEAHRRGLYEELERFQALDGPLMKIPGGEGGH